MKSILKIFGTGIILFTLIANLHFTLIDYGLHTNSLGLQVFAQTGSGGGSGSGSGSNDDETGYASSQTVLSIETEVKEGNNPDEICRRQRTITIVTCFGSGTHVCTDGGGTSAWSEWDCD